MLRLTRNNLLRPLCCLCAVWTLLAPPEAARAHRVHLFAWEEGERVCGRSYYSKKAGIADAEITARSADGAELLRARGDAGGNFCFTRPNMGELLLSVDAGQGHRGEFRLSAKNSSPSANPANAPEKEPGLREIIAGLACIAGLAALLARSRRRSAS